VFKTVIETENKRSNNMATTKFKGADVQTCGELPAVGTKVPAFRLTKGDLSEMTRRDCRGRKVVLNIFPSIDTGVCAASVRRFNAEAAGLPNVVILCVSMDLPFAQGRFCAAEGLNQVVPVSDFRKGSFGKKYGVRIVDGPLAGLLARAVVVMDEKGIVRHAQLVPEITQEPDYAAVLSVLK
jgi:thiol peroxidase